MITIYMNWIEIDKILRSIIDRYSDIESILTAAETRFNWTRSQSEAAVLPLLKSHTLNKDVAKTTKNSSKRLRKR